MKKVRIINIVLNVISISVYLIIMIITTKILIDYSVIEKTEGTGLLILIFFSFNSYECLFLFLLNIIGIKINISNKDKFLFDDNHRTQYKRIILWRVIMIIVPILTFIIQIIIFRILN